MYLYLLLFINSTIKSEYVILYYNNIKEYLNLMFKLLILNTDLLIIIKYLTIMFILYSKLITFTEIFILNLYFYYMHFY